MLQDGYSSLTGEKEFHGKEIIHHGWNRKTKRLEIEEKGNVKRRKILERELEWVRMSPKARQCKIKSQIGSI